MTWSFLLRELMGSLILGLGMYVNITLPFSLWVQEFFHSVLEFDLIICFAVVCETSILGCSLAAPLFARTSALSLPGMSQ